MRTWRRVADTATAGRDEPVYSLDAEAGTIRFGDGVRGRVPQLGRSIQLASLRAGGGDAGNLPAGSIKEIASAGPNHRGRCRASGYCSRCRLPAAPTPKASPMPRRASRPCCATRTGRSPPPTTRRSRRAPRARRSAGSRCCRASTRTSCAATRPGVVSVMVIPQRAGIDAPAPRADRPLLEIGLCLARRAPAAGDRALRGRLRLRADRRLGGGHLVDASQRDAVLTAVSQAVKQFLWPLTRRSRRPGMAARPHRERPRDRGRGGPGGRRRYDRSGEIVRPPSRARHGGGRSPPTPAAKSPAIVEPGRLPELLMRRSWPKAMPRPARSHRARRRQSGGGAGGAGALG